MPKALITQSNYIPWKGYFDAIRKADVLVLYDDMQYTRRDWRNRNKIKTPNGLQWISIPVVVKGKFHQKINETLVSDPDWNTQHWKTILFNYKKAAHFEEVAEWLEPLYLSCTEELLSKINFRFIQAINNYLGINTEIKWSSEFVLRGEKSEKLLGICQDLGVDEYISGPSAKDYLNESLFSESKIKVSWLDYSGYPEYPQLFGEFRHDVTILDLLFNSGKNAIEFMNKSSDSGAGNVS